MPSYRGHADRPDQAKALAAVVVVHLAIGAVILTGLNVDMVTRAVERLKTFDIVEQAPPPPVEEPPPIFEDSGAPEEEAAPANIRSQPTPVVAPPARITPPIPLPTSEVRGPEGSDPTAGAASTPWAGTGAGGQGSGFGGGGAGGTGTGSGAGSGNRPAQLVRNLSDRDYRGLVGGRLPQGRAAVRILVTPAGRATNCRVVQSSGDSAVDAGICRLVTRRLRFRPARDAAGRPIAQELTYIANWRPG